MINFLAVKKKKIQIVCCGCTQRKLREESVPFYTEKRFYDKIDMVFVAPCPRHPYFKERTWSQSENISWNYLNLQKERCNNFKIICFNINFFGRKIKLGHYLDVVPSTVDIVPIETYLEKMNSMLFSYFFRGCFKVQCSLKNQNIFIWWKKKIPFGFGMWLIFKDFNKTCLKFWCINVTDIALISWTFNILILSYLMIAAVPLIMSFSLLNASKNCRPYNLTGFAGNYFFSICCSCSDIDKGSIWFHCKRLRYSLNNDKFF